MLKLIPYSLLIKILIVILEYVSKSTKNDLDDAIVKIVKDAVEEQEPDEHGFL